ncbi:MAG: endonuclease III [Candidatus Faecimonas sp.]|nr:endonuclease III [Mycoplasmatota bacterium]MDY2908252.1 endonuclease III [Candidatus Faecimonas sp.]
MTIVMNKLLEYLEYLFPYPKCELIYQNDYQLLMAIVLSAQSTDKRVNSVTPIIFSKYKTLEELKLADLSDLEQIIRPVGSFRKKAAFLKGIATILVDEFGGVVPTDREVLERFPGVGRKTVNVFLGEFYGIPAIAVDTHVERVSKRLKLAYSNDSVFDVERKLMKKVPKERWAKFHLQMVLFGRYYCKAVKPLCKDCPLKDFCREKKKNLD